MAYECVYKCCNCGEIVYDRDKHDEDCPKKPESTAEFDEWKAAYDATKALWDA